MPQRLDAFGDANTSRTAHISTSRTLAEVLQ